MLETDLRAVLVLASAVLAFPVGAAESPLVCFGNEPSWGLRFEGGGLAVLLLAGQEPVEHRGRETRLDFLKERAWRGAPTGGKGGEVVAFLRESPCSDTMSDATHPFAARVSLPDGRLLAGCCRIPATPLEGPTWRLTSTGDPASGASDARAPPVTARFEGGRVSGFSGCNRFTASYTRDGETLTVGSLAGTLMACPEPRMAIEKGFQDALAGTHRVAISGTRLTLTRASGSPLVFQAEPDPTLEGVVWNVTGFNNGRHAVVSPRVGTALTMTFDKGVVQGNGGCNAFRAPYTSQGNRLSIGAAVTTRKACQADGVMQQEREFLAALESSHLWTVENGLLDVHRADGERVLNAVATPRSPP